MNHSAGSYLGSPWLCTIAPPRRSLLRRLVASAVLSAARQQQAYILSLAFAVVVPTNRSLKLRLLDVASEIEQSPVGRQVLEAGRRDVVRRLAVDQEGVAVRRDRQRSRGHVRCNLLADLVGDALGLDVRDDPVEKVGQDRESRARRIRVDHDQGVLGGLGVVALLRSD